MAIPAHAVNMALQQTATGSAPGVAPPAGLGWVCFAHHTHTDYSDGRDTVQNRILEAASFGAGIVSICDHNTIQQCNDPWFIEQDGCIPMRGDEWGGMGRGHACVLNMTGDDPLDVKPGGTLYTLEEMIPAMLARGGTIFINHPFDDGNPWPEAFAHAGIRGVGAWTTPFPNADARGWWAAHVTAGRMLVGIGESDHHLERILSTEISNSLVPCNYVLAASHHPADVQSAVEAGRIAVAGAEGAARTFVWCDQNGDGVYETPMGTNIEVTQPKRLRFRVEVYGGAGILGNVMVYSRNGGVKTTLGSGTPWRIDYEADVTPATKDYLRSELRGAFGVFQSFSNPIYINHALTCAVAGPASPTSSSPIVFTLTFKEPVTGLTAAGIAVTNGTKGALNGGGNTYTLSVTPSAQGAVTCRVLGNAAWDGVGNGNLESNLVSVTYDSVPPTCVVTGPTSPSRVSPLVFALTFSEPVTGLTATDISVTNGTKGALSGSGNTYTLPVTPLTQGAVTCQVASASAHDTAGNSNLVSNLLSVIYDSVAPTPVFSGATTPTNTTRTLTINFGEMVNGLALGMVTVINGTASNLQPAGAASSYTVDVLGSGTVTVSLSIAGGLVTDDAGNPSNPTSAPFTFPFDNVWPTPVITGVTTLTNVTRTLTIAFSENMNGFSLPGGVSVTNGTASNIQSAGSPGTYTVDVLGLGTNIVSVSIPAGVATDDACNPNNATVDPFTFPFDSVAPTASIALDDPSPTELDEVHFSVDFNENIGTSFDASDVTITGTLSGSKIVSGTDPSFVVTVTLSDPDADGTVGIAVGSAVTDLAGNAYPGGFSASTYTIANWPGFAVEPQDVRKYTGENHTFQVAVAGGSASCQWKWDDAATGSGAKAVHNGSTTSTWALTGLTAANRGRYWCEVTHNSVVYSTRHASMSVEDHLEIIVPPAGGQEQTGASHTFTVATSGGYLPLSYVWKKDGAVIVDASGDSYTKSGLTGLDSGTYTVEVSDDNTDMRAASAALSISQGVPAAGLVGLSALLGLMALVGARGVRRK